MAAPQSLISRDDGLAYWNSIDSTVNGMLGGHQQISRIDMRGSLTFISELRRNKTSTPLARAVDIGAGIGRITAGVLTRVASVVDIVEPTAKFAEKARLLGSTESDTPIGDGKVGEVYVCGAEEWMPSEKYDLIWLQWCLGHLNDQQAVACFERCKGALSEGGWIVVKENMSTHFEGKDMFDELDSSVTRTDQSYRAIFTKAGLKVDRTEVQKGFPADLFPVRMYGLRAA